MIEYSCSMIREYVEDGRRRRHKVEQTIEQRLERLESEINLLTAILHEYVAHENEMIKDREEVEQIISESDVVTALHSWKNEI